MGGPVRTVVDPRRDAATDPGEPIRRYQIAADRRVGGVECVRSPSLGTSHATPRPRTITRSPSRSPAPRPREDKKQSRRTGAARARVSALHLSELDGRSLRRTAGYPRTEVRRRRTQDARGRMGAGLATNVSRQPQRGADLIAAFSCTRHWPLGRVVPRTSLCDVGLTWTSSTLCQRPNRVDTDSDPFHIPVPSKANSV